MLSTERFAGNYDDGEPGPVYNFAAGVAELGYRVISVLSGGSVVASGLAAGMYREAAGLNSAEYLPVLITMVAVAGVALAAKRSADVLRESKRSEALAMIAYGRVRF